MKLNNFNMIRRFALAALVALTGSLAEAESLPIHVSIPFAFTANGNVMPAGDYTVKPLDSVSGAVVLHSGKTSLIALSMGGSDAMTAPKLTFATADAGKALTSISAPGWTAYFSVPKKLTIAKRMEVSGVLAAIASIR
jgi:hypothetical protein